MYDIIIIGAGPAGMTAAIYARRALKKTLIIEALSYGGQIVNTLDIENYPAEAHISGFDFASKLYSQAKELGCEFLFEKAFEITDYKDYKEVRTNNDKYQAKSVIIATGASNKKLGLEKEEELTGKGVSYCAACDGAFYKGKKVAVVGGGNTALEDALYLSNIAEKVYLIHRREEFRGSQKEVEKIKSEEKIEILYNRNVTKLIGEEHLESVEVTDTTGKIETVEVSGLFIAIGQSPSNETFQNVVEVDEFGYIVSQENCHTKTEGIFVAGDTRTKDLRQLVTATNDGAIAATEAIKYISK